MYRSKKSGKRSEATAVVPESSVVTMQETAPRPSTDVSIAASVMSFKARIMAPFMLYDATIRQVVPNPAHDRVFRAEVSRVQGIVLRELRRTLEKESVITPKEMLYGIQKSVMLAYASCAVSSDMEGLLAVSSDEEATCVMARLESFFGDLNASAKAVASVAAVLSTGILRVTFSEACKRLEARLAMEEQSSTKKQRTQEGLLALEATKKNTQDFAQLRGALDTAFEAISTPFAGNGITPAVPKSATADTSTAILTVESYYNLLGWVLMIQPERLGLKYSHATLPTPHQEAEGAAAEAAVNLFAKVTSYDPLTGKIVIERTSPASRWGLVVNSSGALIGLENTLRNSTPAGGLLYHALQERKTGLPIFDINGVNVSSVNEKEHKEKKSMAYSETTKAISLDKIRKVLLESNSVISLTVPKMTTLGQPQEVAFDIIPQGGEGASGQQAALILRRSSIEVQWQLYLREHAQGVLVLQGFSDSLPLSEAAENFLSTHRGHLLIVNANGCDTGNNDLLMDVIRSSLYLVLRLRVVDDIEELGADSVSEQEGGTAMMEVEAEALVESAPATAASHESREAVENEEAEVAQHRALLEENNIHPDEPLPEVNGMDAVSSSTKKKGRGKKPLPIEDDMTTEAVAEPEEMPTDAYELEETSTATKKKGRGKKPLPIEDDMTTEAVAEPEEMPTDAYELEETSTATKKKGRGKNDTEEITAKKETPAKKKKLSKKALKEAKKKAREEKKLKKQEMKKMKDNEETLEAVAEPEEEAPEPISSFEEMAKEEGVMDTPVVNLKSQAMVAAEVTKKIKSTKRTPSPSPSSPVVEQPPTVIDDAPPVSAAELKNAPPLIFENAVTLDRFDGTHMVLRRPDLKTPWDMKVTFGGDKLVLTRLPPISASLKTHPFLKSLRPDMDGQINWRVDEVNGTDLTTATKALRTKAVESIKKANKISLLLRPMIR